MVFHEIDSITDVISGHRVVIYYIEGKCATDTIIETIVCKNVKTVLEMLEKKNDDLLIINVLYGSSQFNQFKELYKPEIIGVVSLFVVNSEGIPIICQHVNDKEGILHVIKNISTTCKLNPIPNTDLTKLCCDGPEIASIKSLDSNPSTTSTELKTEAVCPVGSSNQQDVQKNVNMSTKTESFNNLYITNSNQSFATRLQIRLPNGNRDTQKFDRDAMLQEVWIFISAKYKLKDFDLKTYNHQAFSEEEYEKTLQDLDLYPNGVIIVVHKNVIPYRGNSGISTFINNGFNVLLTKTMSVFRYIHGLLFLFWNSIFSTDNKPSNRKEIKPSRSGNEQSRLKKSTPKPFGTIHTLHKGEDDSDDENNRYNGNSTQQK